MIEFMIDLFLIVYFHLATGSERGRGHDAEVRRTGEESPEEPNHEKGYGVSWTQWIKYPEPLGPFWISRSILGTVQSIISVSLTDLFDKFK